MMPTVFDIASKDIISIDISKTLAQAIKIIAQSNFRTIVIINDHTYHILTASKIIEFKINCVDINSKLSELDIPSAKILEKDLSILNVLSQIDSTSDYMVVTNKENDLLGIISHTDIINNIDPEMLMKRKTIKSLMVQYKPNFVYEDLSCLETIKLMQELQTDSVIVINNKEEPLGIFTTKDLLDLLHDNSDFNQKISLYMSSPIISLNHNTTISKALDFIKEKKFKRIVVVDENNKVSGIVTQKELLRMVYNKWIEFIKEEGSKISKSNEELLLEKTKLEKLASVDFLTKLYNRQKIDSFLIYEIAKITRYNSQSFCTLLIDLDYFKKINDQYGHLVGDLILKEIASILSLYSRSSDLVARWGGEEFMIMLSHTTLEEAMLVAQKIRLTIQNHKFTKDIHLTCSIGISQYHQNDTKDTLMHRADIALYRAKDTGRNAIEIEHLEVLEN